MFNPWVGKIPWRRKRQPAIVFLPGESHGQRSLVGYSSWDSKRARDDLTNKPQHIYIYIYTHTHTHMCEYACVWSIASVMPNSLGPHGLQPTRLLCPWNSPGKNTGVVAMPSCRGKPIYMCTCVCVCVCIYIYIHIYNLNSFWK